MRMFLWILGFIVLAGLGVCGTQCQESVLENIKHAKDVLTK